MAKFCTEKKEKKVFSGSSVLQTTEEIPETVIYMAVAAFWEDSEGEDRR